MFETRGSFCHFWPNQRVVPSLSEKDIKRGTKILRQDIYKKRRQYPGNVRVWLVETVQGRNETKFNNISEHALSVDVHLEKLNWKEK